MGTRFTPRQGQFLAFIDSYIRMHRRAPAESELARHFGVTAPTAHQMVVTLESKGLIERTPGEARSIRVLVPQYELPGSEYGQPGTARSSGIGARYPELADWVMERGWVEIGHVPGRNSMAAALDEGGIVWEGRKRCQNIDELLRDLNDGIAQWIDENG